MRGNIRKIRKKKNMTQKDVAEKICISRSYYNQIEKGNRNPSQVVALKIKNVLDCEYEDLFLNI